MPRLRAWQVGLRIVLASSLVGTTFQAGCLGRIGRNFNPCGTILDCDPVEWDLMFHSYPDWDIDPTCTIPGFCGGQWPPSEGGGEATVPVAAETTTVDTGQQTGGLFGGGGGGWGSGWGY